MSTSAASHEASGVGCGAAAAGCASAQAGAGAAAAAAGRAAPSPAGSVALPSAGSPGLVPPPPSNAGSIAPPPTATAGRAAVAGAMAPVTGAMAGRASAATAGMGAAAGSGSTSTAGAGANLSGVSDAELDMLRQTCVDEINMYRATLPSLKPLKRATAAQEMCSDSGAQMDGDSMMAHGSARAGLCRSVGLGSEDTCPGWPVGRGGNATVADALKGCLKSMWDEGEPPVSRAMCVQDYAGCFEKYGHYLNMSDPNVGSVACSFYKMKSGMYWMNQDFAR